MGLRQRRRGLLRAPEAPPVAPKRSAEVRQADVSPPGLCPLPILRSPPPGVQVIRIDTWREEAPVQGPFVVTGVDPLHVACTAELWAARGCEVVGIVSEEGR